MELSAFTFKEFAKGAREARPGDVLVFHFEPGLLPRQGFHETLRDARRAGARILFVCHWFGPRVPKEYGADLVDGFVVHRAYERGEGSDTRVVEIPLGCPRFVPPAKWQTRARLGLGVEEKVLAIVGFLVAQKRISETLSAVLDEPSAKNVTVLIQTPWPFLAGGAAQEEAKIRRTLQCYPNARVRFSTEFLSEEELLTRVSACDLGLAFHAEHTGSVSATAKQFVAARCPLVLSGSNHTSDIGEGVFRVPSLDPRAVGREAVRLLVDGARFERLAVGMEHEYARLNMDVVADRYLDLFRSF